MNFVRVGTDIKEIPDGETRTREEIIEKFLSDGYDTDYWTGYYWTGYNAALAWVLGGNEKE